MYPAVASRSAVALPMPEEAPVTSAMDLLSFMGNTVSGRGVDGERGAGCI
ncbi:hypothetical protein [Lysobacter gummosus]